MQESAFLYKEACPSCGSKDNLGRYDDGHAFCFSSNCEYIEPPTGGVINKPLTKVAKDFTPIQGEIVALRKRGIREETCKKYGYRSIQFNGEAAQACDVKLADGSYVAQKVRTRDKDFRVIGSIDAKPLVGMHLFSGGRKIVITEGEIDMLTMSQVQSNKYPVVSLINGCSSAKKVIAANLEYLSNFEEIILCFDMDDVGQEAANACADLLMGKNVKIMSLPLKDANEMLLAGRTEELVNAMWNAKVYKPDGLVTMADIIEEAMKPTVMGAPWWMPTLTKLTYGRRPAEIYMLGAGTGMGKTDFFTQQIAYDCLVLDVPVGVFYLEQTPVETAKRIGGKIAGKQFHIPNIEGEEPIWSEGDLRSTLMDPKLDKNLTMYNAFGITQWESLKPKIIYLAETGVKHFFIDHLTAMATGGDRDEKTELEHIMSELAGLGQRMGLIFHVISHLTTPEGKPHEEGGRVTIRQFKGSRSIGYWSYFMFGMERNQQADCAIEKTTTSFRILKDRYTGQSTGEVIKLGYDAKKGCLYELPPETKQKQEANFNNNNEEF
jgi:twinkle protein